MRYCRIAASMVAAWMLAGLPSHADQLQLEFLKGLRERGYDDFALLYIEQLESADDLPAEVREVLDFEKAITLLENAKNARSAAAQTDQLDQAEKLLAQFIESHSDHDYSRRAQTELARILFEKGRIATRRADRPSNRGQRAEQLRTAQEMFTRARRLFQQVHDRLQAEWEQYKGFVDPDDEERTAARDRVEADYIWSKIYLAQTSYERALTYERDSAEFGRWMKQAADEFGRIHEAYRSQTAGLHARLWQGKCFEQLGEIGKALGLFDELLGHPGQSPIIQKIQDEALQFRLVCLNHPERKDYRLAVDESTKWLASHKPLHETARGLGIRWQRAIAFEKLSATEGMPQGESERLLQQALQDARMVHSASSEFREESQQLIQRVQVALGRDPRDPENFEQAYSQAQSMIAELSTLNESLPRVDDADDRAKLRTNLETGLSEAIRLLQLALNLADDGTEADKLHQTRRMLAWAYYVAGDSYRAAVLSEYIARQFGTQDDETSAYSGYLALLAWLKAYNAAPADQRDVELQKMVGIAELMNQKWPNSPMTDNVRMSLGQAFAAAGRPVEAAKWYAQIPQTSPQSAQAQLAAGQAYWTSYLQAARRGETAEVSTQQLEQWEQSAEKYLARGIEQTQEKLVDSSDAPDALIGGKLSLAQIHVNRGNYRQAIDLLTGDPHSVMKAVQLPAGQARPASGVTSEQFAGVCYQLLLRAYVGTQEIEQALLVMQRLEAIADARGAEGVTDVYVQLGREIQKEIERLIAQNETDRLREVRGSFDQFLDELYRRKGEMTYSSLVWVAETYNGLGQGMAAQDRGEARAYFEKAADTYRDILQRDDLPAGRELAVELRLVSALREMGAYDDALQRIDKVLAEKPKLLDAQFEAAELLADWGRSEKGDSAKILEAINGRPQAGIWGWGELALRLQRILESRPQNAEYQRRFFQARYNISFSRQQYALQLSSNEKRRQALQAAMREIEAVAFLIADVSDEWKERFDGLYLDIQGDLKLPTEEMKTVDWPSATDAQPQAAVAQNAAEFEPAVASAETPETSAAPKSPAEQSSWLLIVGGFIAVGFTAAVVAYLTMTGSRRRRPALERLQSRPRSRGAGDTNSTTSKQQTRPQTKPRTPRTTGAAEIDPRRPQ